MHDGDDQQPVWTAPPGEKIGAVIVLLDRAYGPRPWRRHGDPVDVLIGTILSQNTSDRNAARAFAALKARFSTWDDVRQASLSEVVDAIRTGGLANRKGPRIKAALNAIAEREGRINLDSLGTMPVHEASARLTALNGVGPKTAACVLLFSFCLPALPVDTHVYRVAGRLGLISPKVSPERAHGQLLGLLGDDAQRIYAFHMEMIAHGRAICTARQPACARCPVRRLCRYVNEMSVVQ